MRIRVNETVDIRFEYPEKMPERHIPPLIFISFVENAFKHGINPLGDSFIHIRFLPEATKLVVNISNSKAKRTETASNNENIGLNNSRRRLDILFGDQYRMDVYENESTFEVVIEIPLV
jgi:LytS/YehU family sensor histidine kinase